jgi:hypothetical protein
MTRLSTLIVLVLTVPLLAGEPVRVTTEEADARLRRAYSLAQESNDARLVERVLMLRDAVRRAFPRKDLAAAERLIRDAEDAVGLDPGGRTMLGLPVTHIDPARRKELEALEARLAEAMKKEDPAEVATAVGAITKLLGDEAGLPDVRRAGDRDKPVAIKPGELADLFIKQIEADPRWLKMLSAGVPTDTLPRTYASVVQGCVLARPLVEAHRKEKLEILDGLVRGCCKAMLTLQLDPGFFRFPDLRGKHLWYGEAIETLVEQHPDAVRDGWVVVPDPTGASQIDAAECGIALLRAGSAYKNADWTAAGRKAADWSLGQPCVPTFYYNAMSVSLLCEAFRATKDQKYLDGARKKFAVGVAPAQSAGGRWLDPVSARTANHVVLIRALNDLVEVLPAGKERDAATDATGRAIQSLLDEGDKLGAPATSHTVQELSRYLSSHPEADRRVRTVLDQAAGAVMRKAAATDRSGPIISLPELAALKQ